MTLKVLGNETKCKVFKSKYNCQSFLQIASFITQAS